MLEKFNIGYFIIIRDLECMELHGLLLHTLFIFLFWQGVNYFIVIFERVVGVKNEPRWYDLVVMLIFLMLWLYGVAYL